MDPFYPPPGTWLHYFTTATTTFPPAWFRREQLTANTDTRLRHSYRTYTSTTLTAGLNVLRVVGFGLPTYHLIPHGSSPHPTTPPSSPTLRALLYRLPPGPCGFFKLTGTTPRTDLPTATTVVTARRLRTPHYLPTPPHRRCLHDRVGLVHGIRGGSDIHAPTTGGLEHTRFNPMNGGAFNPDCVHAGFAATPPPTPENTPTPFFGVTCHYISFGSGYGGLRFALPYLTRTLLRAPPYHTTAHPPPRDVITLPANW